MTNEEITARLQEKAEFAPTLVGLELSVARQRADARGFTTPDIVEGSGVAVPLSLDPNRIWLIVNEDQTVVRALLG